MNKWNLSLVAICILFVSGCNSSTKTENPAQGQIRILLVDSPATYDSVNVVVREVSVHEAGADSSSGWIVLDSSTRTFDLLTLTNGASRILADGALNAGHCTQIRLKLADGSRVTIDGQTHPLEIPSGLQSGLKLNHEFDIQPNTLYELTLDFDAAHSIKLTGNDRYVLQPVIRVVATRISGTISGTISPASAEARVFTVAGADTISTEADTNSGAFMLMAVPAGTYAVHVTAAPVYRDTTVTGVVVVAGHDTPLGTIMLQ